MSACSDVAHYFPDPQTACAVCTAESGANPNAIGDGGTSYGLFQIHAPAHPDFDLSRWSDPNYNAQYAANLQASSGWGPWSTFNSGAYRQYLGACGGSASAIFPPDLGTTVGSSVAGVAPRMLVLLGVGAVALLVGAESLGDLA